MRKRSYLRILNPLIIAGVVLAESYTANAFFGAREYDETDKEIASLVDRRRADIKHMKRMSNLEAQSEREIEEWKARVLGNTIGERKVETLVTDKVLDAVSYAESGGNVSAVSRKGAIGPYQIIPGTWEQETRKLYGRALPISEAKNPEIAREVAKSYLEGTITEALTRYSHWENLPARDRRDFLFASYNCGEGRVAEELKRHNSPEKALRHLPRETREYVQKINKYLRLK